MNKQIKKLLSTDAYDKHEISKLIDEKCDFTTLFPGDKLRIHWDVSLNEIKIHDLCYVISLPHMEPTPFNFILHFPIHVNSGMDEKSINQWFHIYELLSDPTIIKLTKLDDEDDEYMGAL